MEAGKGCGAHVTRQMVTVTGTHSHRIQLLEFWSQELSCHHQHQVW